MSKRKEIFQKLEIISKEITNFRKAIEECEHIEEYWVNSYKKTCADPEYVNLISTTEKIISQNHSLKREIEELLKHSICIQDFLLSTLKNTK